jgi:hypothetical protein
LTASIETSLCIFLSNRSGERRAAIERGLQPRPVKSTPSCYHQRLTQPTRGKWRYRRASLAQLKANPVRFRPHEALDAVDFAEASHCDQSKEPLDVSDVAHRWWIGAPIVAGLRLGYLHFVAHIAVTSRAELVTFRKFELDAKR